MANITKAELEKSVAEKDQQIDALKQIMEQMQAQMATLMQSKTVETKKETTTKKSNRKKIPLDTLVPVRSGVEGIGGLVYVSKKTGYTVTWDEFGTPEYLEVGELLAMRNGNKKFFENNWIYLDDTDEYTAQEILEFLQMDKYYEHSLTEEEIDGLFNKSVDEIKEIIKRTPTGVKDTIATKALKVIDDLPNKTVKALEEALGVELMP